MLQLADERVLESQFWQGSRRAEEMVTRGRMLPPAEALRIGLIDEVCAPNELDAQAQAALGRLLEVPEHARSTAKLQMRAEWAR